MSQEPASEAAYNASCLHFGDTLSLASYLITFIPADFDALWLLHGHISCWAIDDVDTLHTCCTPQT